MPATDHQAVLEVSDIQLVMDTARRTTPKAFALTAWMYEFGARGAEPGLQLLKDVDMKQATTLEYARTTQAALDELEGRMSKVYGR